MTRTERDYLTLYNRSLAHAREERHGPTEEDFTDVMPIDLVNDLWTNKRRYSYKTLMLLRSALLHGIERDKLHGWQEAIARLNDEALLEKIRAAKTKVPDSVEDGKNIRESGRMIPEEDFDILIKKLFGMKGWGQRAALFLIAGVNAGARPVEWINAKWIDTDKTIIRFLNAKVKSRNAWDKVPPLHFELDETDSSTDLGFDGFNVDIQKFERHLSNITDLTLEELSELRDGRVKSKVNNFRDVQIDSKVCNQIDLHMAFIDVHMRKKFGDDYRDKIDIDILNSEFSTGYFNMVRQCIWRACKALFPDGRKYSPADARSTFSANRKASQGLKATSLELGHAGLTTSRFYYAPAQKAWSRFKKGDANSNAVNQAAPTTQETQMLQLQPQEDVPQFTPSNSASF